MQVLTDAYYVWQNKCLSTCSNIEAAPMPQPALQYFYACVCNRSSVYELMPSQLPAVSSHAGTTVYSHVGVLELYEGVHIIAVVGHASKCFCEHYCWKANVNTCEYQSKPPSLTQEKWQPTDLLYLESIAKAMPSKSKQR